MKLEYTLFLSSPQETERLGRLLGERLKKGSVVALIGDLGAGKTCLAQGMAKGLGIAEEYVIVSPTFTLVNEYPGRIPFFHLDVYRLESGDFHEAGLDEYFSRDGVAVIEWAEKIVDELPESRFEVELSPVESGGRKAVLRAWGKQYTELLGDLKSVWNKTG
ncbi:MAG: tRNA (adenosine(37)-N6)-threonylcarbamoyltransferase complex ATPase subunit type 1 TsaE [Candidatus Adiutricales bacterium]